MQTLRSIVLALIALPLAASGQTYPAKPIRVVVGFAVGGAADTVARAVAQRLAEFAGQPVIVENRIGGTATIAANNVAMSVPDGYTILLAQNIHYIGPFFSKNIPYDPFRDFSPIIGIAVSSSLLSVHASLPIHSMKELIDYAKKNPSKLFYGTTGVGSMHHLGGLLLAQMTGIDLEHVPYKGGNPTISDLLGGQIPLAIIGSSSLMPHVRTGKLRALGLIQNRRFQRLFEVPTIGETVPGYAVPDSWWGYLGPAAVPRGIVDYLNDQIRKSVQTPDVRQRLESLGFEVTGNNTAEQFAASVRADTEAIRKIVTAAGIRPE